MNYPWLSEEEIEARAQALLVRTFRDALDRTRPIDLEEVLLHLSDTEGLSYNLDAELIDQHGVSVLGQTLLLSRKIRLSRELQRDLDPGRARFTLAHEIGHWVLHRPMHVEWTQQATLIAHLDAEEAGLAGVAGDIFPSSAAAGAVPREEWQANRFAVALLIDAGVLRTEFERRFGAPQIARRAPG